jgi:hypothetical protein
MDYKQTRLEDVGWIYLAQWRNWWQTTANAVMNLWVLWSAKNLFSSGSPVRFSRVTYFLAISFESNFQQRFSLWRARDYIYVKWLNFFLFDNNTVLLYSQQNKNVYPMPHSGGTTERNVCCMQQPATNIVQFAGLSRMSNKQFKPQNSLGIGKAWAWRCSMCSMLPVAHSMALFLL